MRLGRHGGSPSHIGDLNTLNQFGGGNASLVRMHGAYNTASVHQTAQTAQTATAELTEAWDRLEAGLQQDAPENAERLGGQLDLIRQMNRDNAEAGLIRQMINVLSNGLGQVLGQQAPELIDMAQSTLPQGKVDRP